jgi:hypothetical protein
MIGTIAEGPEDELVLPVILEGFRVRVGRFFDQGPPAADHISVRNKQIFGYISGKWQTARPTVE